MFGSVRVLRKCRKFGFGSGSVLILIIIIIIIIIIGTRQGGTLSPYLFSRYIRELLGAVSGTAAGCYIGNHCFNILAYADDLVVLAPS